MKYEISFSNDPGYKTTIRACNPKQAIVYFFRNREYWLPYATFTRISGELWTASYLGTLITAQKVHDSF